MKPLVVDESVCPVALLAEGVDRNCDFYFFFVPNRLSPSSRRAWIEIVGSRRVCLQLRRVALLAEGVDRNVSPERQKGGNAVALLAEGVDRNSILLMTFCVTSSRPPRGGRG